MADAGGVSVCMPVGEDGEPNPQIFEPAEADPRSLVLAGLAVGAFLLLGAVSRPAQPDAWLSWLLNPTGLVGPGGYFLFYLLWIASVHAIDRILHYLCESIIGFRRIDKKGDEKVRRLEVLGALDICLLAVNSMVSYIGLNHVMAFAILGPAEHRMRSFYLMNGPLAFMCTMVFNEVLAYGVSWVAHSRGLFPLWAAHHHRQPVPFRGLADAANQHPFELMSGLACFLVSLQITAGTCGVHAGTAVVAFGAWVAFHIVNHLAVDSKLHLPLPYPAFTRDHQMHHRHMRCNFGSLTSMCDRLCGTYREFRALDEPPPEPPRKLMWYEKLQDPAAPPEKPPPPKLGRPEVCPAWWSFAGVMVSLIIGATIVEFCRAGELPEWHAYMSFAKATIVMTNFGLLCFAVEAASSTPVEPKGKKDRMYTKPTMRDALKEAVPQGHVKSFVGGKTVYKPSLKEVMPAKPFKRE